jgi:hypothetical protein
LGDWAASGGHGGGRLEAEDILVVIRMLIFLMADFGYAKEKKCGIQLLDIEHTE